MTILSEQQISALKSSLVKKTVNEGVYYYFKLNTPILIKEYYVGKYTENQEELENLLLELFLKVSEELLLKINDVVKTTKTQFLNQDKILCLEVLRISYDLFLKEFDQTSLEKYEEQAYTKYVQGTTNIEGSTYTLRETDLTLNKGITVEGKPKREFFEIENYSKLKTFLDAKNYYEINIEFIKTIHSFILKNIDDNNAGTFRKVQAYINGTDFIPAHHEEIQEKLEELINWYKTNQEKVYPIELISQFHQRFEEIHPFVDGNGRVGRELIRLMLKNNGYPQIFIGLPDKPEYLNSLDLGNDRDYSKITNFLADKLIQTNQLLYEKAIENFQMFNPEKNKDLTPKQIETIKEILKKITTKPQQNQ